MAITEDYRGMKLRSVLSEVTARVSEQVMCTTKPKKELQPKRWRLWNEKEISDESLGTVMEFSKTLLNPNY